MFELVGKRALITGATGGIGRAIAEALQAQGAVVGLSGTRAEVLEETADALGEGAHVLPCNLADPEALAGLVPTAIEAMGGLDILINNAGITRDNLAMRMKDEDWDIVLRINLDAGFKLARAALRGMMKARWGRIISITSVVGTMGNPGQANYAAAKAGTVGMSKAMAQEVASRGITVNCVAPGFIDTAMTEVLGDDQRERLVSSIPAGRLGLPTDVATGVAFLASEEASYITGQTLHVNGGMAMI